MESSLSAIYVAELKAKIRDLESNMASMQTQDGLTTTQRLLAWPSGVDLVATSRKKTVRVLQKIFKECKFKSIVLAQHNSIEQLVRKSEKVDCTFYGI